MLAMHGVSEFEVRVFHQGDATVIAVTGEIDLATVGDVRAAVVAQADAPRVVFDLTGVTFMDSSGVHLIDEMLRTIDHLSFRVPTARAGRQALAITGMLSLLPLEPT